MRSKRWAEVTREERFCCAELYSLIRRDVLRFIDYQNVHHLAGLDAGANWEVVFKLVSIKGARCPGSAAKRLGICSATRSHGLRCERNIWQRPQERQLRWLRSLSAQRGPARDLSSVEHTPPHALGSCQRS